MAEFIKLSCAECDNIDCKYVNILGYISIDFKKGCSRWVSEDEKIQYIHYMKEIIPSWRTIKKESLIQEQYNEICNFLDSIYSKPIGCLYDKNGKFYLNKKQAEKIITQNIYKEF